MNRLFSLIGRVITVLFFSIILFSCDDASDDPVQTGNNTSGVTNVRLIADAGVDLNVTRGSTVSLDGSNSTDAGGKQLSYKWSLVSVPSGSNALLTDDTSPTPSFVADLLGEYAVSLVVSNGIESSVPDEVSTLVNTVLIYENDFSQNSLNDFIVGELGVAQVLIDQEQIRINPGELYANRGYVALDVPALSTEYTSKLIDNQAKVIWAFNVSNINGVVCGACNNLFLFRLSSKTDPSDPAGFGYRLEGGGFVGSRFVLSQSASSLSIFGPVSNTMVDITDGLETLPKVGAFKLVYDPGSSLWELYYDEDTIPIDPLTVTNLVGSAINSGFVSENLPYLILGSYNTSSAFFDNLTVMLEFSN